MAGPTAGLQSFSIRMSAILRFLKDWTLAIAMTIGASTYLFCHNVPGLASYSAPVMQAVSFIQPLLIFCMLFIAFCKVDLRALRPCRWHWWLVAFQSVIFTLLCLWLILCPHLSYGVVVEGAILSIICPTAAAGAVITGKLGGNAAGLTAYTLVVNLCVAILIPLLVPLTHPQPGMTFVSSFLLICAKVFPILILPLVAATIVRHYLPRLCRAITSVRDLAFYIWCVSLSLAIAVTTRSLVGSHCGWPLLTGIALSSHFCCAIQFAFGRWIGRRYGCPIAAGQSLGQKNTMFAIWMGYTFLTPVSTVAGGFYSVWHNIFNSWQLYQQRKHPERQVPDRL